MIKDFKINNETFKGATQKYRKNEGRGYTQKKTYVLREVAWL